MNRIIAAFDGLKLSASTAEYAMYMARRHNAHITAIFLQDIAWRSEQIGTDTWWPYYSGDDMQKIKKVDRKDEAARAESVVKLSGIFQRNGIHFNIHQNKYFAFSALLNESHFADMILIEENATFSNYDKKVPSRFIKDLLHDADCPVMLLPKKFRAPEKVIFACDGSPSSVYAIRQFCYLFPELPGTGTELLYVSTNPHSNHIPGGALLHELLKHKYPAIRQRVLREDSEGGALLKALRQESASCLVVMGAYRRSALSMWLHRSEADALIKELKVPLFIAHR